MTCGNTAPQRRCTLNGCLTLETSFRPLAIETDARNSARGGEHCRHARRSHVRELDASTTGHLVVEAARDVGSVLRAIVTRSVSGEELVTESQRLAQHMQIVHVPKIAQECLQGPAKQRKSLATAARCGPWRPCCPLRPLGGPCDPACPCCPSRPFALPAVRYVPHARRRAHMGSTALTARASSFSHSLAITGSGESKRPS